MAANPVAIYGGSGMYEIPEIEVFEEVSMTTPFGDPSDAYFIGRMRDREVVFLSRHGRGHVVPASHVNFRANIYGFKKLGADTMISVNAVGSMQEDIHPRDIVIPDQYFDLTKSRKNTFFDGAPAVHVDMADPVCPILAGLLHGAARAVDANVHMGGVYLTIEGSAFSTRAESRIFRSWGVDLIGMTMATEAKLAREAEMCFASLSLVTDYDVWKETADDVSSDLIIQNLMKSADTARKIIVQVIPELTEAPRCACRSALSTAIITRPNAVPAEAREKLQLLLGKYLPPEG